MLDVIQNFNDAFTTFYRLLNAVIIWWVAC